MNLHLVVLISLLTIFPFASSNSVVAQQKPKQVQPLFRESDASKTNQTGQKVQPNKDKSGAKNDSNMNDDLIIKKERLIMAKPSKVWQVLTDPEFIGQWLGTKITIMTDWKVGSPMLIAFIWKEKKFEDKGNILAFEPEKKYSYNYWSAFSGMPDSAENYSVITFDLIAVEKTTKLLLTHSNFSTPTMYEHSDKNWEGSLNMIKKLAEENTDAKKDK